MLKTLIATVSAAVLSTSAFAGEMNANEQIVADTLKAVFSDFDATKAGELLAEDYIQHSPSLPTGSAPIIGFIPQLKESGITYTTHRIFSEGDIVVTHNSYENAQAFGAPSIVTFDVFRVKDGKITEHWDNIQPVAGPNASGHSMVDGTTEITDLDKTEANKALITKFADDILIGGKMDKITDYISPEEGKYAQHNPMIGDGLDALGKAFAELAKNGMAIKYTKVHHVIGQGNFVLAMSEGTLGDKPTAYYDLFRVEDGKIAEHWDVISEIPATSANENGKF